MAGGSVRGGLVLVGLGVLTFSFTFPATVVAQSSFDPWTTGIGRAVIAAAAAMVFLAARRVRPPRGAAIWRSIVVVAVGIVVGFPLMTALALEHISSAHAAVVTGLLPLATALVGVLRAGERPSRGFWVASVAGALAVIAFTLRNGLGTFGIGDAYLVAAIVLGGIGYAEGGSLSRSVPGWQVISWALVVSLPVTMVVTVVALATNPPRDLTPASVTGLAYVALFSMFLGFCAWYPGLARVGIARGSQMQLLQPLLTVLWSALLLGRGGIDMATVITAMVVLACVAAAQRSRFTTLPTAGCRLPVPATLNAREIDRPGHDV